MQRAGCDRIRWRGSKRILPCWYLMSVADVVKAAAPLRLQAPTRQERDPERTEEFVVLDQRVRER